MGLVDKAKEEEEEEEATSGSSVFRGEGIRSFLILKLKTGGRMNPFELEGVKESGEDTECSKSMMMVLVCDPLCLLGFNFQRPMDPRSSRFPFSILSSSRSCS